MEFREPGFLDVLLDVLVRNTIARPVYKRYVNSLELRGDERVLDFGSGSGAASRYVAQILSQGNGQLTCVDASKVWMRIAKRRLKGFGNADFKQGDIRNLAIEAGSYDVVLIHFVLHDVDRPVRQDSVKGLARILRSGGKLLIKEPTGESHGMPADEIRELMAEAGLEEIEFRQTRSIIIGPIYRGKFEKPAKGAGPAAVSS